MTNWGVSVLRFRQIQTAGVILVFISFLLRFYILDQSVNPLLVQFITYAFIVLLMVIIGLQVLMWYRR